MVFAGKSDMVEVENADGSRPFILETRLEDLETEGREGAIEVGTGTASACGGSLFAFCLTGLDQLDITAGPSG